MAKRGPSVRAVVLQSGGIQQPPRRRPARSLSVDEREEISRGIAAGDSCRRIARRLGRAPSTVSREVARNGGRRYRAQLADAAASRPAARSKPAKLAGDPRLRAVVEAKLRLCWSPEQIAGWLQVAYPDDPGMRISHETIYLSLYVPHRGSSTVTGAAVWAPAGRCATRGASACPGERPAPGYHLDPPAARRGRWAQGPGTRGRRPGAGQVPSAVLTWSNGPADRWCWWPCLLAGGPSRFARR